MHVIKVYSRMAYIADILDNYLDKNADQLLDQLTNSHSMLLDEIGSVIKELWIPLDFAESSWPGRVAAVDGGSVGIRLDNGGLLAIISAYGISEGFEERLAECTIIYPPHPSYVSLLRQKLELTTARKLIMKLKQGDLLLLDGSLYGLLSRPPITPVRAPNGYGSLLLDFYSELANLLNEASNRGVWLVSISKVSSSRFVRDYALYLIHQEEVSKLRSSRYLEPKDLQSIETLLHEIFRNPMKAYMTVRRLKARYGALMNKIELIAREGLLKTPDLFLLKHYTNGAGFTRPLLLGPSSRLRDSYDNALANYREYTVRRLLLEEEKSDQARETLQKLIDVTAVASFYLRLNPLDYPLKVDLPASSIGIDRKFFDVVMPEPVDEDSVEKLVSSLKAMYGGKEVYNVWLYEADRRARLRKDEIRPLIEILERRIGQLGLARRALL